jgi:D-psicose/D-tagatose/L-ribulose 3-epimerase
MIRLSYIVLPRLTAFKSPDQFSHLLRHVRECGYDGVELNLTEPFGIGLAELARMIREVGLAIPSFLTGEAYADGLCLSAADASVRRRTVERLIRYVGVAARFNAVLVVGLLQGLRRDEPDPNVANRRIAEGLKQVAEAASAQDVDLVIEPVNHLQVGFNNTVAEVQSLIAAIGSPAVRPMVDTIHLNIEEHSLTDPILDCGKSLRHVHLCESNGGPFGTGHVDFMAVGRALNQIGYSGFASVKVYRQSNLETAARESINHLRRIGFAD